MIRVDTDGDAVILYVKLVPGASRTRFEGEWDGRARVAVAAPPERGKANAALISFLAKRLGLRASGITVTAGAGSPLKKIRIAGTTPPDVRQALRTRDP